MIDKKDADRILACDTNEKITQILKELFGNYKSIKATEFPFEVLNHIQTTTLKEIGNHGSV